MTPPVINITRRGLSQLLMGGAALALPRLARGAEQP